MSTKEKLIEKISTIEDPELLLEIDRWITTLIEATVQDTYSKEEIAAVHEGYEQYRTGETIDQNEAKKFFIEWLKEKAGEHRKLANLGYTERFEKINGSVTDENFTIPDR